MVGVDGCEELCWDVGRQASLRRTPNFLFVSLQRKNKDFSSSGILANCSERQHLSG